MSDRTANRAVAVLQWVIGVGMLLLVALAGGWSLVLLPLPVLVILSGVMWWVDRV